MTSNPATIDRPTETRPLALDDLFAEQQSLTAVEAFARTHDAEPEQAKYYKSLIPATPPRPGEQYSFEVDLDACSGCKACVVACHSLNGLDDDESWRDVGQLHGKPTANPLHELPVIQHVTTACHHCLEPGCLSGCPVNAYEKDPHTGIVRHLDDQCLGCQYCTLMCPYEVPKYHANHGIVRKCDMCSDRLSAGEAPACVQACPHEAIRIRTVSVDAVRVATAKAEVCRIEPHGQFAIPDSPPVGQTIPTTVYKSKKLKLQQMEPVDLRTPTPAHAHLPLTAMLAFSQIGVGGFIAAAIASMIGTSSTVMTLLTVASFMIVNAGLGLATLHLGRPHLLFRAVLGWRHSWLSREALAFGGFMPFAATATSIACAPTITRITGIALPAAISPTILEWMFRISLTVAAVTGAIAVMTSVMIYVATKKPLWALQRTTVRFALTTTIGGSGLLFACESLVGESFLYRLATGCVFVGFALAKARFDAAIVRLADGDRSDPLVRSAVLLEGPLRTISTRRLQLAAAAIVCSILSFAFVPLALLAVVFAFAGELAERWLFFTAATGPKMPGQVVSQVAVIAKSEQLQGAHT